MILISVIIPIYNTEKYLPKCIESILSQTYGNFELLLINDGSVDNSGRIIDKYALNDDRIQVFHKENGGVSSARNFGIDNAKGDWICFIDSDDYVNPDYLNSFVERNPIEETLIVQGVNVVSEDNKILQSRRFFEADISVENTEFIIENDLFRKLNSPYCKLFNKHIIKQNRILFPEGISLGEDILFVLNYLSHIKYIKLLPNALYNILSRRNSLSTKPHKYQERLKRSILAEPVTKVVLKNFNLTDTEYGKKFMSGIVISPLYDGIEFMYFLTYTRKERIAAIKELLNRDKKYFYNYEPKKLKRKFQHNFLRFMPAWFHDLVNVCWFSSYKLLRLLYRKIKYNE